MDKEETAKRMQEPLSKTVKRTSRMLKQWKEKDYGNPASIGKSIKRHSKKEGYPTYLILVSI